MDIGLILRCALGVVVVSIIHSEMSERNFEKQAIAFSFSFTAKACPDKWKGVNS